ncbi:hypothetical protein V502_10149, partial [Pseudogymnoascus sp. VKM F-4520 (FW-2644)]
MKSQVDAAIGSPGSRNCRYVPARQQAPGAASQAYPKQGRMRAETVEGGGTETVECGASAPQSALGTANLIQLARPGAERSADTPLSNTRYAWTLDGYLDYPNICSCGGAALHSKAPAYALFARPALSCSATQAPTPLTLSSNRKRSQPAQAAISSRKHIYREHPQPPKPSQQPVRRALIPTAEHGAEDAPVAEAAYC